MKHLSARLALLVQVVFSVSSLLLAQQAVRRSSTDIVPPLVKFSGVAADYGKQNRSVTGITIAIYKDQEGGSPLWIETQNVFLDQSGRYDVMLGATRPGGLPAELFASGDARWVGIALNGEKEQPRVLLLSVPYALKAADSETVGGLPASAFVLAAPPVSLPVAATDASVASTQVPPPATVTGSGTASYVPLWTSSSILGTSALFQAGSGSSVKIGINTATPQSMLDVKGSATIRALLNLPATATAKSTGGANSNQIGFVASTFNSGTSTASNQVFRWMAEPVANNTTSPSATLNLLFGTAPTLPAETGLKINSKGQITFANGQTFPGTGPGTITGVTPGTDLTGGGTSGNITLNLDTAKVPQLSANNSFNGNNFFGGNNAFVGNQTMNNFTNGVPAVQALDGSSNGATTIYAESQHGNAILGISDASSGSVRAIQGQTASSTGIGVLGNGTSSSGSAIGVLGSSQSPTGKGVFGEAGGFTSVTGSGLAAVGVGVWGDGGTTVGHYAVMGTVDDGAAGVFENNGSFYTLFAQNSSPQGYPFDAFNSANGKGCNIDPNGNLSCSGSKNAVVPINGGNRRVALAAIESPKNWFEDFGSGQLVNGVAVVTLDPDFIETVNTTLDYKVFPVPNGDCKGLYVTRKTPGSFEVRELGGGRSSVSFDYRISALRRKYESIRFADHTNDPDPRNMIERRKQAQPADSHMNPIVLLRPATLVPPGKGQTAIRAGSVK